MTMRAMYALGGRCGFSVFKTYISLRHTFGIPDLCPENPPPPKKREKINDGWLLALGFSSTPNSLITVSRTHIRNHKEIIL